LYRQQLTEVLSRYGEMFEVWFDGSNIVPVGDILKKYAPNAIVFQGPHANIRWVGNEHGFAPYPAWNSVPNEDAKTGTATARHGHPDGTVWMPLECDARIRAHWFWTTENAHTLKSVQELMDMYYRSVGHGAVLLLNQTPDTTGLIPEQDAKRAAEFYNEVTRRLGKSVVETKGEGRTLELDLGKPTRIDHIITMEDIRHGERIRRYIIEGFINDQWGSIAHGVSVGHKKIDRFDPLAVSKVRIRITESAAEPRIRRFAVFAHQGNSLSSTQTQLENNIIYRWNMTNISTEWTPVQIDLKPYCEQAGQYKLIFQKTGGPNELIIQDVRLLESGVPLEHMVEKESDYAYFINITAVSADYELEIICRQSARPGSMGHIELLSDFK
jgi:alpha-L-fucosidase